MIQKRGIIQACLLASVVLFASAAYAQDNNTAAAGASDCSAPIWLPDKPTLNNTPDYGTFLARIMAYKKARRKQDAQKQRCPQLYTEQKEPNNDPTVVEGPETLPEALQRARRLSHLDYGRRGAGNKSTARSFALPHLSGNEMSNENIAANLQNLAGDATPKIGARTLPLIYSQEFNQREMDGRSAQQNAGDAMQQSLPTRQQDVSLAFANNTFGGNLGQIVQSDVVNGSYLRYYFSKDGNLMLISGVLQVENCLSSCSN